MPEERDGAAGEEAAAADGVTVEERGGLEFGKRGVVIGVDIINQWETNMCVATGLRLVAVEGVEVTYLSCRIAFILCAGMMYPPRDAMERMGRDLMAFGFYVLFSD